MRQGRSTLVSSLGRSSAPEEHPDPDAPVRGLEGPESDEGSRASESSGVGFHHTPTFSSGGPLKGNCLLWVEKCF